MRVVPVPVRSDNYAYLLIDDASKQAAAVDPYDMTKVQAAAQEEGVQIIANLTTHHHYDHSGGNKDYAAAYPGTPVYGGSHQSPALTQVVKDNDELTVADTINVRCLATPCHTRDSICYYATDKSDPSKPGVVFTGDTLFQGGCGRFFEGNGADMHAALSYLGTLPDSTVVHNGHEYTKSNLAFAKSVEPDNLALQALQSLVADGATTGRSTISDEKEWNVFMRLNSSTIRKATGLDASAPESLVMDALRDLKNNFKG